MDHLKYVVWGAPVWVWIAAVGLLIFEDALARSRLAANSTVQLLLGALGFVGRRLRTIFPAVGAVPEPSAPILPSDSAPTEPTRPPSDHGSASLIVIMALALLTFACALALAGCGATSDDLHRACASEEAVLAGAYGVGAAGYRVRIEAAKNAADGAAARARLTADTAIYDKFTASLDGARAAAEAQCSAADAIDAGQKKDVKSMISIVVAAGVRVAEAVASIEAAFGGGGAN